MKTLFIIIITCCAFIVKAQTPEPAITLQAQKNTNSIELKWTASQELSNTHYTIERSADGESFTEVTQVGNSFFFRDQQPSKDIFYYRIKYNDNNNEVAYSNVISINDQMDITIMKIYEGTVSVEIYSPFQTYAEIMINDITGTVLTYQTVLLDRGYNTYTYSGKANAKPIIHAIKISDNRSTVHRKFYF